MQLADGSIRENKKIIGIFLLFKLAFAYFTAFDSGHNHQNASKSKVSIKDPLLDDKKLQNILSQAMKIASYVNEKDLANDIKNYLSLEPEKSYEIIDEDKILSKYEESKNLISWNFIPKIDDTTRVVDQIEKTVYFSFENYSELSNIDKFEFNIFKLHQESEDNSLQVIMNYLFRKFDLFTELEIPPKRFQKFIERVQSGYKSENPYHNAIHAADVVQTYYYILNDLDASTICNLSSSDAAICYLSAAIHDFQHPGFNNSFLINSRNKLAMLYNDISVLENFHISAAFNLLTKPSMDIFVNFPTEKYREFRTRIIDLVLATDMSKHFSSLRKLKKTIEKKDLTTNGGKLLVSEVLMHICDVSNPFRPFEVCQRWAQLVNEEFFNQGDKERELGLPVSPTCDRYKVIIPSSQINFARIFIDSTLETVKSIFPKFEIFIESMENNKKEWERLLPELSKDLI